VRDAIGNRLVEGSVLFMQKWGVVARVTKIHDGGLSIVGARGDSQGVTPPVITITIDIPLDNSKLPLGQEASLDGILCVRDPKSEVIMDSLLKRN
jgi:hypothetical protein